MPSTVTVTGKVGPASTVTALVLTNVSKFSIDTTNELLTVELGEGSQPPKVREFDISAATTITCTVSGNSYTLTIS